MNSDRAGQVRVFHHREQMKKNILPILIEVLSIDYAGEVGITNFAMHKEVWTLRVPFIYRVNTIRTAPCSSKFTT